MSITLVTGDTLELTSSEQAVNEGRKPVMVIDGEEVFFGGTTWRVHRKDAFDVLRQQLRWRLHRKGHFTKAELRKVLELYAQDPPNPTVEVTSA